MRVSIVTISYNQAAYLERCIQSIIAQDYDDMEYIVVDPGSTDGSRDIIDQYSARINCCIFEPDEGPADGLNKGFSHATGDIFFYLNADDEILPGAITTAVSELEKKPSCDILLGHGFRVDSRNNPLRPMYSGSWTLYKYATGCAKAVQQATFFRKEAFLRVGGFNQDNKTFWDGELLVDMVAAGATIEISDSFFGIFRIHSQGITGSGRLMEQYHIDKTRLARRILGRELTLGDRLLAYWVRLKFRVQLASDRSIGLNSHVAKRVIVGGSTEWR